MPTTVRNSAAIFCLPCPLARICSANSLLVRGLPSILPAACAGTAPALTRARIIFWQRLWASERASGLPG